MAKTAADFFRELGGPQEPAYRAEPWYNPNGDSIHYHWRPDEFYAERIDDKLTVYRSMATDDAVGCQIKGVGALLKQLGDFGISVDQADGAPLAMFLFVSQASARDWQKDIAEREKTYRYLLERAGRQRVELTMPAGA